MFEILPNPSLETVLIAVRGAALIIALWVFALAFARWRRADESRAQQLSSQLEHSFTELRSLHETIAVMSARLEALSERAESDARLAPAGALGLQRGYELAARLARNGVGIEELVATCGITRHEAQLLTRLHGASVPEDGAAMGWQMRAGSVPSVSPQNRSQALHLSARGAQAEAVAATASASRPANVAKRGSLLSVVG